MTFGPSTDDYTPKTGLLTDAAGDLFGVTGGNPENSNDLGSVFEIAAGSQNVITLADFNPSTDDAAPLADLTMDSQGNLYGTTGGNVTNSNVLATVYEITAATHVFSILAAFGPNTDDYTPKTGLLADAAGDLFGVTGGNPENSSDLGSVFEISTGSHTITTLADFNPSTDDAAPLADLTMDSQGNLYGTTGGNVTNSNVLATVYEITAATHVFSILAAFGPNTDDYTPKTGLLADAAGDLFGVTGGNPENSSDLGSVFEISTGSHTITTLADFNPSTDDAAPLADLTMDSQGNLYGTTSGNVANSNVLATVYEITAATHVFSILAAFGPNTDDYTPKTGLLADAAGDLFGVTGGNPENSSDLGSVFEISTGSHTITTLADFNPSTDDAAPLADLTMDSQGNLYGTTSGNVANSNIFAAAYEIRGSGAVIANIVVNSDSALAIQYTSSGQTPVVADILTIAGTTGAWTGQLNITDNDLDISKGSLSTITNQVAAGYAGGKWNGEGINSSSAASDSAYLTAIGVIENNQGGSALFGQTNLFDGVAPGSSDILVKYTYYGDTNLDGKVDGSDYARIDNAYLSNLTRPGEYTGWFNGDFNYDGVINGSDYTLIDNAFNRQGATFAGVAATATKGGKSMRTVVLPLESIPATSAFHGEMQILAASTYVDASGLTHVSALYSSLTTDSLTYPLPRKRSIDNSHLFGLPETRAFRLIRRQMRRTSAAFQFSNWSTMPLGLQTIQRGDFSR